MNSIKQHPDSGTCIRQRNEYESPFRFTYCLYERSVLNAAEANCFIYSLSVMLESETGDETEQMLLDDISRNTEEALRIFNLFADGTVTPNTALYIIDEVLAGSCYLN